jgi:hypothetical protein
MIKLSANISLVTNSGSLENLYAANTVPNNISANETNLLLNKKIESGNPFLFGSSKLGEGATYSDGVDYYIARAVVPQKSDIRIILTAPDMNNVSLMFGKVHPTSVIVDGVEYNDNDNIFLFSLREVENNEHLILIPNWDFSLSPFELRGVYVQNNIEINSRNMQSLSRAIYDRSDLSSFSFGVLSNGGSLQFSDFNGEIADYAEQNLLVEDLDVVINLSNTLTKKSQQIAKLKTDEWTYDNDNRSVSVSLKDDLEEWQNIQVFPMRLKDSMNAYNMCEYIKSLTPEKWVFEDMDDTTKNVLTNMTIKYPYLEQSNLWSQWNKLCELCGLHIYKNADAKVVIRSEFGV